MKESDVETQIELFLIYSNFRNFCGTGVTAYTVPDKNRVPTNVYRTYICMGGPIQRWLYFLGH